jgi:hypothetical protein
MKDKVEKPKMMNDHNSCTKLGVDWFLCGPEMIDCKSGGLKGCNDWQDRCCFTPIAITFGAIELTVLCAFVCKVGYFDAQIRETLLYK